GGDLAAVLAGIDRNRGCGCGDPASHEDRRREPTRELQGQRETARPNGHAVLLQAMTGVSSGADPRGLPRAGALPPGQFAQPTRSRAELSTPPDALENAPSPCA